MGSRNFVYTYLTITYKVKSPDGPSWDHLHQDLAEMVIPEQDQCPLMVEVMDGFMVNPESVARVDREINYHIGRMDELATLVLTNVSSPTSVSHFGISGLRKLYLEVLRLA